MCSRGRLDPQKSTISGRPRNPVFSSWCMCAHGRLDPDPKPSKSLRLGAIYGPKPYKSIGFGAIYGPKPYKSMRFGAIYGTISGRPRNLVFSSWCMCSRGRLDPQKSTISGRPRIPVFSSRCMCAHGRLDPDPKALQIYRAWGHLRPQAL